MIINEFRYYEVKIEESEKVGSHQESNPGHLWLVHAIASQVSFTSFYIHAIGMLIIIGVGLCT